jgi:DNA-binding transcriptional regulator LsrR (DeoR family)
MDALTRAAWWYYVDGWTQEAIAERLHVSRATVVRMLQRARQSGIVEIRVHGDRLADIRRESELAARFGLRDAIVVAPDDNPGGVREALARAAARYLTTVLAQETRRRSHGATLVGLGWGHTLGAMARYVDPPTGRARRVRLVELMGAPDAAWASETRATLRLSERMGVHAVYLNAPAVVSTSAIQASLLGDAQVRRALAEGAKADVAFVGVGSLTREYAQPSLRPVRDGEAEMLRRQGAVGDILGMYFNIRGERVEGTVGDRTLALDWDALAALPLVVGVAGGAGKGAAVLGALRSGVLKALITDQATADFVVAAAEGEVVTGVGRTHA